MYMFIALFADTVTISGLLKPLPQTVEVTLKDAVWKFIFNGASPVGALMPVLVFVGLAVSLL